MRALFRSILLASQDSWTHLLQETIHSTMIVDPFEWRSRQSRTDDVELHHYVRTRPVAGVDHRCPAPEDLSLSNFDPPPKFSNEAFCANRKTSANGRALDSGGRSAACAVERRGLAPSKPRRRHICCVVAPKTWADFPHSEAISRSGVAAIRLLWWLQVVATTYSASPPKLNPSIFFVASAPSPRGQIDGFCSGELSKSCPFCFTRPKSAQKSTEREGGEALKKWSCIGSAQTLG